MCETKKCGHCKNEYPKTSNYFFVKISKQKLASGKIATYKGYRSICKKCHAIKGEERRVKKRCKELNCDISDYREKWKKQYTETRTIDLEAKINLTEGQYNNFKSKIKKGHNIDYKEYLENVKVNKYSKPWLRKFDYDGKVFLTKKEIQNKSNKNKIKNITDVYITNYLGVKKEDIPKEVIETKRLLIKIKRQLNLTNYERQ